MSDEKSKTLKGHGVGIGIATGLATGYFVLYVKLNDIFSWPSYVYNTLAVFVGVLFLFFILFSIRSSLVKYYDSKQEVFMIMPPGIEKVNPNAYFESSELYEGLTWKVIVSEDRKNLYDIDGPFCSKEDCYTELNRRTTFFGRYKYECPTCSFKRINDYNIGTLKSNFGKVTKARLNRQAEEKFRREMNFQKEQFEKDLKELKSYSKAEFVRHVKQTKD